MTTAVSFSYGCKGGEPQAPLKIVTHVGKEKVEQRPKLVQIVLDGRAGQ